MVVYPSVANPWVVNVDKLEVFSVTKVKTEHAMCLDVRVSNVHFYVVTSRSVT